MSTTPEQKISTLRDTARSTVSTAGHLGAMMLPFASREHGAANINASLRTFMKPGTWFAPMWAWLVGCVASGNAHWDFGSVGRILLGMFLAGPLLCALSQVVNDWYDRDVDRINEPERPTAANQLSPGTVAAVSIVLFSLALIVAFILSPTVGYLAIGGIVLALAYSMPPARLKARNGWFANAACAFSYEGFAWVAGAASFGHVSTGTLVLAALYSLGSHGLMTLNDFKSYEGDRRLGLRSLPVLLGPKKALTAAIVVIDVFQVLAIAYVVAHHMYLAAAVMAVLFIVQLPMQRKLAADPAKLAPWYCATGIPPFVWGMLAAALAVRSGGF
jgi:chlorophyll synthase